MNHIVRDVIVLGLLAMAGAALWRARSRGAIAAGLATVFVATLIGFLA